MYNMIYKDFILENASKDARTIDSNLIIFYAHAIKYISLKDQNSGWIGSMKHSGKKIYKLKNLSPSVYKNFDINIDNIFNDIFNIIFADNKDKELKDFKYKEVFSYFYSLDIITDAEKVKEFLLNHNKNENLLSSIDEYTYD